MSHSAPHRSEREKMLASELYNAADAELVAARLRARQLLRAYNNSDPADLEARAKLLAELIGKSGSGLYIEPPFSCDYGANITCGTNVYFNFDCVILDVARVTIGDRVMGAPGVHIYTAGHPIDAVERASGLEWGKPVTIGDDVWLGGRAVVCPGVAIGARSVIGAGSVVTRDIPPDVVAAGNPCRVIKELKPR